MTRQYCYSTEPTPHPWHDSIRDAACGYALRLEDRGCQGCWRCRSESALEQLRHLDPRHTEDGLAK